MANIYQAYVGPLPLISGAVYPLPAPAPSAIKPSAAVYGVGAVSTAVPPAKFAVSTVPYISTASVIGDPAAETPALPHFVTVTGANGSPTHPVPTPILSRTETILGQSTPPPAITMNTLTLETSLSITTKSLIVWVRENTGIVQPLPGTSDPNVQRTVAAPPGPGGGGSFQPPTSGQLYPLGLQ